MQNVNHRRVRVMGLGLSSPYAHSFSTFQNNAHTAVSRGNYQERTAVSPRLPRSDPWAPPPTRTSLTRPAPPPRPRLRPHPPLPLAPGPELVLEETLAADQGHAGGKPSFLQETEPRSAGGSCLGGGQLAELSHYLGAEAGERGEDAGVDEAELRLDLVAAEVMDRLTVLVQDQVLGVGPEPKTDAHTISSVLLGRLPPMGRQRGWGGQVLGMFKRVSDLSTEVTLRGQTQPCPSSSEPGVSTKSEALGVG